jgi:DNA-binding NarL/FixJ family response regulator
MSMNASTIRLFLVDDHRLFLAGLRAELGDGYEIVGDASDVNAAIDGIIATSPDVVLLDVHLPGGGGETVLRTLADRGVDVPVLALSVSDAAEDVIGVIRAGARGYVTKTIEPDELARAIRRIYDGDAVFSPRLAGFVLDAFHGAVAQGFTYKQIASRLNLSIKTVESHVSAVLRKLQLSSRHELTVWATNRKLI